MTLFWHNHFVVEFGDINDARMGYEYCRLLRQHALGNFKQLAKDVTVTPAMLRYLNGNQSTVGAPNENYGRELLELFTVGKGPLIGPGNYTNYTEADVQAAAKVLTGWRDLATPAREQLLHRQPPRHHHQGVFVGLRQRQHCQHRRHRIPGTYQPDFSAGRDGALSGAQALPLVCVLPD